MLRYEARTQESVYVLKQSTYLFIQYRVILKLFVMLKGAGSGVFGRQYYVFFIENKRFDKIM